jgi:NADPH:quinone reductase-like Zn-dependent oxidoreductase
MKAIVIQKYGPIEDIEYREVEKPVPGEDEVLVKVFATSVNFNNLIFVKGEPLAGRFFSGLFKPNIKITGNDLAGKVEAAGPNITGFQPGDEVYGDLAEYGFGTFAEYVSVPEKALARKPANLSFVQAAAVPEAALVALQALRDTGQIQPGKKVLISGASGGIGTFAVQIAKYYEAEVTGVCGSGNLEMVRSLGADHVIDYTKEDFARQQEGYDLILATAGYRSLSDYKRILNPGGIYVATGGTMKQIFQAMLLGPLASRGGRKMTSMAVKPNQDLDFMRELLEAGRVKPVIDKEFPLSQAAEAMRYYDKGHARGKVVITVAKNN